MIEEDADGGCRACGSPYSVADGLEDTGICWPCEIVELRAENLLLRTMLPMGLVDRMLLELYRCARSGKGFERAGGGVALRITQQALGDAIGHPRESVNRRLKDFAERGLIGHHRKSGFIEVLPALLELVMASSRFEGART